MTDVDRIAEPKAAIFRESADHWSKLADDAERMAAYDRSIGLDLSAPGQSAGDYRAADFRRCAAALRLAADDGKARCHNCLRPLADHGTVGPCERPITNLPTFITGA